MWLNQGRRRPGMVGFGPSAWKAEQQLLGSPNRENEATVFDRDVCTNVA